MVITRFPSASEEEIKRLKEVHDFASKTVKKVDDLSTTTEPTQTPAPPPVTPIISAPSYPKQDIFQGGIAHVEVTREPIQLDNPCILAAMLCPELKLYPWQFEELMRSAGYLTTGKYEPQDKSQITQQDPYKVVLSCANGSGKDMVIIALFAVWFILIKPRNRVVITSSSQDQTKFQTEVHIRELANRANKKFGNLFRYCQFHYVCPELGSEIKLFATDEAGRAEGYHPYGNGDMALIINEAKSVKEDLFDAFSRCTGYSHWLEISSPGQRSGHMYRMASTAVHFPAPAELGKFYFRKVTAYECPHIAKSHIDAMAADKGVDSPWFRSSILAEFSEFDEVVVITPTAFDRCFKNPPPETGSDIGIGLDLAGGGDEDACFVRKGNRIIHKFFFRLADTDAAVLTIDKHLSEFKQLDYIFRADNGGIGQAMIDKLVGLGWRIRRTNNQSPAFNKKEFLNLGAEMYFYVKRLIERNDIILPDVHKLREQLTTRHYDGESSRQGKFALESKKEARSAGRPSPDRADAFVLCMVSYRPTVKRKEPPKDTKVFISAKDLIDLADRGLLKRPQLPLVAGRFTLLNGKL